MNVSSNILRLATQLTNPATRRNACDQIASLFGGQALLVFVRDPEIDELLTAPGFPQTLPNRRGWRAFLQACVRHGYHTGNVWLHSAQEALPAIGVAETDGVVVVVVGAVHISPEMEEFRALLPLVAAAFRGEQQAAIASAQAQLAAESGQHAESLIRALNDAQRQLKNVNAQLRIQAQELESQAIEMEVQTDALVAANEELREAREAAERANRAKSEFLSTISHELRTPLNAISGYVQLLQIGVHGPLTAAQRETLERVERSQHHLLSLINDVLNLARIEAGGITYDITEVLLNEVVADTITMIDPQLLQKSLMLEIDIDGDPVVVRADRERLDQIVLNLLSNAVKFTEQGSVKISAGRAEDAANAFISVADTGRGIPREMLDRIFEPFVQIRAGTGRPQEGSGLGLAISRDLAEGMNGVLSVQSTVGVGSCFTVTLPLALPTEGGSEPRSTAVS